MSCEHGWDNPEKYCSICKQERISHGQRKLERIAKKLEKREENCERIEEDLKEIKQRVRALRADIRGRDEKIERLEKTIISQKRQIRRIANQNKELQAMGGQLNDFVIADKLIRGWMTEDNVPSDLELTSQIVTVGLGPFPRKDFNQFLIDKGYKPSSLGNEEAEIMVVGRTDWTEEELEKQIAARRGDTLKIYSQEMCIAALATGRDPFETADEETLLAFGRGHPALEHLMELDLKWPSIGDTKEENLDDESIVEGLAEESPLHLMGYSVGISGLEVKDRHTILAKAFENKLPQVKSDRVDCVEYMAQWGKPKTRRRLWRMANHIAWLARFRQSNPSMSHAVKDWKSDLIWLQKTYYKPSMSFTWPGTVV